MSLWGVRWQSICANLAEFRALPRLLCQSGQIGENFEASSKSGQNWLKTAKFCLDKISLLPKWNTEQSWWVSPKVADSHQTLPIYGNVHHCTLPPYMDLSTGGYKTPWQLHFVYTETDLQLTLRLCSYVGWILCEYNPTNTICRRCPAVTTRILYGYTI